MGSDNRQGRRPTYLRKGGKSQRLSDQSIWDYLRQIERVPAPRTKLIQNPKMGR